MALTSATVNRSRRSDNGAGKQGRQQEDWVPPGTYVCLGRDGGRPLRFVGCGFFGKIAFDTWQGQLRPHHGAARRQRRGADPGKNHEPGQRHGGMAAAEDQGTCDPARTQGASPLHPCQGSATLGTRNRNLTAAPRTKEPASPRNDPSGSPVRRQCPTRQRLRPDPALGVGGGDADRPAQRIISRVDRYENSHGTPQYRDDKVQNSTDCQIICFLIRTQQEYAYSPSRLPENESIDCWSSP